MTFPSDGAPVRRRTFLSSALAGAGTLALSRPATAASPSHPAGGLTAQTTEGPYYLALNLNRADITEGLSGIPLDVTFTVVDEIGRPYEGALVDIWHCDAQGLYSGFDQPGVAMKGKTFLRGTLPVGADGAATFHSIYPGWYQGRTTHIHFKVRRGALTNLTSQFFLPDTLSEYLYTQVEAYRRSELRDTLNSEDGIAIEAGATVEGAVRESAGRYVASLLVRVDRNANPAIDRPPAPGEGGPGGFPPGPPPGAPPGGPFPGGGGRPVPGSPPPGQAALTGEKRVAALLPTAPRSAHQPPPPPPGMKRS
ncbi:MAG: intradiol ring-cleavage dioxygenase [Sphingomonas sp.]|nr:MAG: intradiol ring-cleavage dioxygenase [Sphingomonas sp.]